MTHLHLISSVIARIQVELDNWNLVSHNSATIVMLDVLQAQLDLVRRVVVLHAYEDMADQIYYGMKNVHRLLEILCPRSCLRLQDQSG